MLSFPRLVPNLLDITPRIGEPIVELPLRHAGVVGKELLLAFVRVRVLRMLLYPLNQDGRIPPPVYVPRRQRGRDDVD